LVLGIILRVKRKSMKSNIKKILCLLLACLCLLPSFSVMAEEPERLCEDVLQYEMQKAGNDNLQDFVNSAMTENPTAGFEWYCLALKSLYPELDFSRYGEALAKYVETNNVTSAATRKKIAFVLIASGKENHPFVGTVRNEVLEGQGVMSYVFALHFLNNGVSLRGYTAEMLVQMLLDLVLEDGGWALNGKDSDVDVTAMVLQSLAPHRDRKEVKAAIDKALICLSSLQKPDGDFTSYGVTNPESTAQVMMALVSLGINPLQDPRFVQGEKNLLDGIVKYRLADGSYCHTEAGTFNQNATVQVFCALNALTCGNIYDIGDFSFLPLPDETQNMPETTSPTDETTEKVPTWKWYILGGILLIAALFVIFLLKRGKQGSAFLTAATAILLSVLLFVVRVQTPDDYYRYEEPENPIGTVNFSIRCDEVAGRGNLPKDGVVLAEDTYSIGEGDTVYDLLLRVTKAHKIPLATSGTYSAYITGIDALFEFDYGSTSGWVYTVNGKSPTLASNQYGLQDGDTVVFFYTLTLGSVGEG